VRDTRLNLFGATTKAAKQLSKTTENGGEKPFNLSRTLEAAGVEFDHPAPRSHRELTAFFITKPLGSGSCIVGCSGATRVILAQLLFEVRAARSICSLNYSADSLFYGSGFR
jgi:hypothetical protein